MKHLDIKILIATLLTIAIFPLAVLGQEDDDDSQQFLREHPDLGPDPLGLRQEEAPELEADYSLYPFLHLYANKIELNGADWSGLRGLFAASADTLISIVHIGDSHIQAEGSTSRTRSLLQRRYGSAGRGLVIPFRLAGTNQPLDYAVTSDCKFDVARIMKRPWPIEMGFTGIALRPKQRKYDITLAAKPCDGAAQPFETIRIYANGDLPMVLGASSPGIERNMFDAYSVGDTITVFLREPAEEATLHFQGRGPCEIYGFDLDNAMMGLKYSAIGNNGAAYTSYNGIGNIGRGISSLQPNLIIVSLGTNEAFGSMTDTDFYDSIDVLVNDLQQGNPAAQILLTTPPECQRAKTVRTGKKRRRTKTYSVNAKVARMRDTILRYGRDHGIATYDFYDVAGGQGSSDKWLGHKLMNTDRVHNTWSGYALQGCLLYDALIQAIEQ